MDHNREDWSPLLARVRGVGRQHHQWADDVSCRIHGALSDLYDEEARYHRDCLSRFFENRTLPQDELESSATQSSSLETKTQR